MMKMVDFKIKYFTASPYQGGRNGNDGTMTFGDFYSGGCSEDGRLCSFLSRSRTKLFRNQECSATGSSKGCSNFFKGKLKFLSGFITTSGFIDRSALPKYQGPYGKDIVEGKDGQDVWTCETGVLDGHVPNAIENLKNAFPIFAEGDFSKLVHFIRDHKLVPNVNRLQITRFCTAVYWNPVLKLFSFK